MMIEIENVKPGTIFTCLGVEYRLLRHVGEIDMPNRNQWGRAVGGTHKAHKVAVKVNKRHRGWWFSYTGFPKGATVRVVE